MAVPPRDPSALHARDLALVRAVLVGDPREVACIGERLRCIARILRVLNLKHGRALLDDELADVAQDVLVIVWRKLPGYGGDVPLEGWVYGICGLELMNALRRKQRRRSEVEGAVRAGAVPVERPEPDPWAFEDLHAGLDRLAGESARVIRMKHFEDRTFEEIAAALDTSPNTIKARYYRGMMELRRILGSEGDRV
jgi:RNA polymerase sigma factor (sigma-70 family)